MDSWNDISFEVNIANTAKFLLNFIKKIDQLNLYEGVSFHRALYRYEQIWLCILKNNNEKKFIVPPLDVQYIWYLHILSPTSYVDFGYPMDYLMKIQSNEIQNSNEVWEKFSNMPYDYTKDESRQETFKSKIKYDFISASLRQRLFVYQVSLNHFENEDFLARGLERYKKFLFLKKTNPKLFLMPCFLINLIWCAHIFHLNEYKIDTEKIFGQLLPYDGAIVNRLITIDEIQMKLWRDSYNEDFFQAGAMFRGTRRALSSRLCDPQTLTNVEFTLKVENIFIQCKSGKLIDALSPVFEITLYNLVNHMSEEIVNERIETNNLIKKKIKPNCLNIYTKDETIILTTVVHEKNSAFLEFCPSLTKQFLLHKSNTEIIMPTIENTTETQIHEFNFLDKKSTIEYSITLSLVLSNYKRQATYFLNYNSFNVINKNQHFELLSLLNEGLAASDQMNGLIKHATHQLIVKNQKTFYTVEILMTNTPFPFCGFKIQHLNSVLSISKLIDNNTLPTIGYAYPSLSLDLRTQRAMLVQSSNGDYAILKAEWICDQLEGNNTKGYLKIDWYSFEKNFTSTYIFKDPMYFKFKNPEDTVVVHIDLKHGAIDISFSDAANKTESILSCILAILQLNTLVIPKKKRELINYRNSIFHIAFGYSDFEWNEQFKSLNLHKSSKTLGVTFINDEFENDSVIVLRRSLYDETETLHENRNRSRWIPCTVT